MIYINDNASDSKIKISRPFGKRRITHVFHDIDGTHSLIREWQPVMSLVLYYTITNGLEEGYDSAENTAYLIKEVGRLRSEETDRFCVESAGLSALTQMEWSIRRAVEEGTINLSLSGNELNTNSEIISAIWRGEELFDNIKEPECLKRYLTENTPRLFKLYEKILNGACRDKNLEIARKDPESMRVKGSFEFVRFLNSLGLKNYLVTGAVISYDKNGNPYGGMYEEITTLGFKIAPGADFEAIEGSTWNNKIPKNKVMERICAEKGINPENVLVIGDGRSEIEAGVKMGGITMSVLPESSVRQREIHKKLGTNIILSDYTSENLTNMFTKD